LAGERIVRRRLWDEVTADNPALDRRFMQSAGPFILEPGDFNNITVGAVWARAVSGGPLISVDRVIQADSKAQTLFDNCFRILNGPDAPDVEILELERSLVITLSNSISSNNAGEDYLELDPTIPETEPNENRFYRFQGYQVFQVKDEDVSVSDLGQIESARLLFQCDIKDGVSQIINYLPNEDIGLPVATEMVNGSDTGVAHSFLVTEDLFAKGDPRLVNFKTYYYIAVAYGYNNWQDYNPDPDQLTGQPFPYLRGRKSATGSIRSYRGIPHAPDPASGGTVLQAAYGDRFPVTRIEGQGNGGFALQIDATTEAAALTPPNYRADRIGYLANAGPLDIKVIDPLNVPDERFQLRFVQGSDDELTDATWELVRLPGGTSADTVLSEETIEVASEQLLPEWGMSITIKQVEYQDGEQYAAPTAASVRTLDGSEPWLEGLPDTDNPDETNWIRAGTVEGTSENPEPYPDLVGEDDTETYEKILGGTWAPFALCGDGEFQPVGEEAVSGRGVTKLADVTSTLVVLTPDKSKWSRCPVFEMTAGDLALDDGTKSALRRAPSVDKNGQPDGSGTIGMGWFPGYAIDQSTGERMNIAFGENSFWGGLIGRDMIWNPSSEILTDFGGPIFGGGHWIFVFRNERLDVTTASAAADRMPGYDEGQFIYSLLSDEDPSSTDFRNVWRSCAWVGSAILREDAALLPVDQSNSRGLIPVETRIILGAEKTFLPYQQVYPEYTPPVVQDRNNGLPLYEFGTSDQATLNDVANVANSALDMIGVVPNPYYGFSGYETNRLDNRVKFVNLPQACTIKIFTSSGTLVRQFKKDNNLTFLDWDLKNGNTVPIAGGTYICHIDVPGVGEKVVKWFGVMRPLDLQNF
jgi:hypothetical protein